MKYLLPLILALSGCNEPSAIPALNRIDREEKSRPEIYSERLEYLSSEIAELKSAKNCRVEMVSEEPVRTVFRSDEGTFVETKELKFSVPCVICNHAISCAFSSLEDAAKRRKTK